MNPGRLVLPALRWRPETGFGHEQDAIAAALEAGAGGFIIFGVGGARADEIGRLTEELRQRAGRPLLLAADLERGAGQQARRLTEIPPPAALAALEDDDVIAWAGRTTALEARRVGLNWVFAPVADLDVEPANPIVQTRSFGSDPRRVARQVVRWIAAAQDAGVLAAVKHYPGHGRTRTDSHQRLPAVDMQLAELEATDLVPFRAAVEGGVAAVMTAHVAYPAWDPTGTPATRSPVILGYLRAQLGFRGLVVTDALIMEGARGDESAEVEAIRAGCDLLLYPPDPAAAARSLAERADRDPRFGERVEEALAHYDEALRRADGVPAAPPPDDPPAAAVAARLLDLPVLRGPLPGRLDGLRLEIVDDDLGGWYAPGPNDLVRRGLAARGVAERFDGDTVVLAFAEPRAAKGRAGFGPEALAALGRPAGTARLIVLFGHPRLLDQLPDGIPVLCAWHRQPLMQSAVSDWLAARLAGA